MALTQVRVKFGDTWHELAYHPATGRYEGTITPPQTSANQPQGYYILTAEAVNDREERCSVSGELMPGLRLTVRETAVPDLILDSPAAGYLAENRPEFVLRAQDLPQGSGVDPDTFSAFVDGTAVAGELTVTQIQAVFPLESDRRRLAWTDPAGRLRPLVYAPGEYGYLLVWTPARPLNDGAHTLTFSIRDRDGNPASASAAYTVDTASPTLELTAPDSRRVVDWTELTVAGRAADAVSGVAGVAVQVNGTDVPVSGDPASFFAAVPLKFGGNDIVVTAADRAGLTASRTLRVLRMVTGRTRADVDRLVSLLQRGESAWTAEERAWWDCAGSRLGGYDSLDTNRVTEAMELLRGWLEQYGYAAGSSPSWPYPAGDRDVLTASLDAAYCAQVRTLRGVLPVPPETPEAPATLRRQGAGVANDIERILVAVDALRPLAELGPWWPCGTINCGGVC